MAENHLYRANLVAPDRAGEFERALADLEDEAASIIRKLLDPTHPELAADELEIWAMFVLAQMARLPEKLRYMKQRSIDGLATLLSEPDPEFTEAVGSLPYANLWEVAKVHAPSVIENFHLRILMRVIMDEEAIRRLLAFKWAIGSAFSRSLILGDNPVVRRGNLYEGKCMIALPISPNAVFIATSNNDLGQLVRRGQGKWLVAAINHDQAVQAHQVVVGHVEPRFLEKRFQRAQLPD